MQEAKNKTVDHVIFFDIYQTLIDVRHSSMKKKKFDESDGWKALTDALLRQERRNISPSELATSYGKRRDLFYSEGKDPKIHHHDFLILLSDVLTYDFTLPLPKEKVLSLTYTFRKADRGYLRLYPGVYEVLSELSRTYILATASYTQGSFTHLELQELDIRKFFSYFVYSSDIGYRKESPEFYRYCLHRVGKRAHDCMMIGDSYEVDIRIPQSLGMKTLWVRNPLTSPSTIDELPEKPEHTILLEEFALLPQAVNNIFLEKHKSAASP